MPPLSPEESIITEHLLIEDEGLKQFPYFDCCGKEFRKCGCKKQGKLTIGVGRNIEDIGLSDNEVTGLLANDVKRVVISLERIFPWFNRLTTARRVVLVSMGFNLGIDGLIEFKQMVKSIESGDFESAGNHMLASKWAAQVKGRAVRLAQIMKSGQF